jgi:hypothetical protein
MNKCIYNTYFLIQNMDCLKTPKTLKNPYDMFQNLKCNRANLLHQHRLHIHKFADTDGR